MSLRVPDSEADRQMAAHVGELRLRRLRLHELGAAEAGEIARHLERCPPCRLRLDGLDAEQRAFAQAIPFPRFAGGVERAVRVPRGAARSRRTALIATGGGLACAAAAGLLLLLRGGGVDPASFDQPGDHNRIKGGPTLTAGVRIASADGRAQRSADPGSVTRLAPGERLRLGYTLPDARHVMVVSVDDAGVITPLHGEAGDSILLPRASSTHYLPDSIELTGAGRERLYLFVSAYPFAGAAVDAAVRQSHYRAGRDLSRMAPPLLPPEVASFTWLFEKP